MLPPHIATETWDHGECIGESGAERLFCVFFSMSG